MPTAHPIALALTLILLAHQAASAADWPRFRGPNGTGVSDAKSIPVQLGKPLWKQALPGIGHSSPVVASGRVYLQSASADGNERTVFALDLNTGKTLWSKAIPGETARTHNRNTLASCSAAVDGDRVFIPVWNGSHLLLLAFSTDGKSLWERDLGEFTSQHGPGHSPMIAAGLVILAVDQDGASQLLAFKPESGETAWSVDRPEARASYAVPFLQSANGAEQLIVASTTCVTAYNPKSGETYWNWNWTGNRLRAVASPVSTGGLVFVTGGDGGGNRHAVALKIDGTGDVSESALAWEHHRTFPYVPSMLVAGDALFFVNDRGVAGCFSAKTGDEIWTNRLGGGFSASPVLIDGKIYAVSEEGDVVVLAADTSFKELGRTPLGEAVYASPAVADGKLLIRGRDHVFCFGE